MAKKKEKNEKKKMIIDRDSNAPFNTAMSNISKKDEMAWKELTTNPTTSQLYSAMKNLERPIIRIYDSEQYDIIKNDKNVK